MSRATEIIYVKEAERVLWLAEQVDELETTMVKEFTRSVDGVRSELRKNTEEMVRSRRVMTGLMVSLIVAIVVIPLFWIIH